MYNLTKSQKTNEHGQLLDWSGMKGPLEQEEPQRIKLTNKVDSSSSTEIKYDAMVIYGNEDENVAFAKHLVQRLESLKNHNLNILVPQHLEIDTFQQVVDCISNGRCKRVIAILSPSFFNDPINKYLSNVATFCSTKTNEAILLPVILGNKHISNIPTSVSLITKLKYDPKRTYTNFWKNLMKSFNIHDLTEEDMKMDFELASSNNTPATMLEHVNIETASCKTPKMKFPFISMIMRKSHPYKKLAPCTTILF